VAGPERTLDYYWYDLFEVPLGEWYDMRAPEEVPWEDSTYNIYNWSDVDIAGNIWFYTMMRMDVTGTYMDEISMNVNPVFIPQLGTTQGGTAVLDWHMQYLTQDECFAYSNQIGNWADGWIIQMGGDTTLDFEAAQSVLGMPADQWDTFDTWWADNSELVELAWDAWLHNQANVVFDIWTMYEYPLQMMVVDLEATKVGDTVVVDQDMVSWGQEALMARWLRYTFMDDYEPYFDDFNMVAEIGPETTNLSISTAIQYALYAYATTDESIECWTWEALRGDYATTDEAPSEFDRISEYDLYVDETYLNYAPGSEWYGLEMTYDYVPGVLNISEGETLSFEWPAGDVVYAHHIAPEEYSLVYGPMTVDYAEPMGVDFPGQVDIDTTGRTITYTGPIDFWTWSKTQTRAVALADEWDRLGLLPYGMPTVEFRLDSGAMLSAADDGLTASATPEAVQDASVSVVSSSAMPESVAGVSASSEMAALTAVAVAVFMLLMAFGASARRAVGKR